MERIKLEEAIREVLRKGKDGNEHMVVLRPPPAHLACGADERLGMVGDLVLRKDGDENKVDVGDELDNRVFKKGDIVVHNHPKPYSLSTGDLGVAWKVGATIWAVTPDGGRYCGKPADGVRTVIAIEKRTNSVFHLLCQEVGREALSEKDAAMVMGHLVCLVLSKVDGVLSYNFKLGIELEDGMQRFKAASPQFAEVFRELESR